jgi:hypothetical protein
VGINTTEARRTQRRNAGMNTKDAKHTKRKITEERFENCDL